MMFLSSLHSIRFMIGTQHKKLFSRKLHIQLLKMFFQDIMVLYLPMVKQVLERLLLSVVFLRIPSRKVSCQDHLKQSLNLQNVMPRNNIWLELHIWNFITKKLEISLAKMETLNLILKKETILFMLRIYLHLQ